MPKINTTAPAALIWLPERQKPTVASFGAENMALEDAMDRTTADEDAHPDELPWIKTEGNILGVERYRSIEVGASSDEGLQAVILFEALIGRANRERN
jgi:hypothetical protein